MMKNKQSDEITPDMEKFAEAVYQLKLKGNVSYDPNSNE